MTPTLTTDRSPFEWGARWIVWFLGVGTAAVVSVGLSLTGAHAVLVVLARLGVRLDGKTETVYGLLLASMCAPIPVLLVSQALAPARRWIMTAAVCAAGLLLTGLPRPGDGWAFVCLWFLAWTPSWATLAFLFCRCRTAAVLQGGA